jgi:hypothetical protein
MATIRYEIMRSADGWRVHCNGVEGPAYADSGEAIRDTLFTAANLEKTGERVEVRILELDGPRKVWRNLEARDAAMYR